MALTNNNTSSVTGIKHYEVCQKNEEKITFSIFSSTIQIGSPYIRYMQDPMLNMEHHILPSSIDMC